MPPRLPIPIPLRLSSPLLPIRSLFSTTATKSRDDPIFSTPSTASRLTDLDRLSRPRPRNRDYPRPEASIDSLDKIRQVAASKTSSSSSSIPMTVMQDRVFRTRQGQMSKKLTRKWSLGDVYAPRDIGAHQMRANGRRTDGAPRRRSKDVIDRLGINPLDMYKNPAFLQDFMTQGGSIMHSRLTGLRPVNQRRVAKAIRRAIGMGLLPSVHRHPEILKVEFTKRRSQISRTPRG